MTQSNTDFISLFKYLKEFSSIGQRLITDITAEQYYMYLSAIPLYKDYVTINPKDSSDEVKTDSSDVLIMVSRPDHSKCECRPDDSLLPWIDYDWEYNYIAETTHKKEIDSDGESGLSKIRFEDDANRIHLFNQWKEEREAWRKEQMQIQQVDDFYEDLYRLYQKLDVDSETIEFLCGNGLISSPTRNGKLNYPILTKRIRITYESDSKDNCFCIRDTEVPSQVNSILLNSIAADTGLLSTKGIADIYSANEENDYHPLDSETITEFLSDSANKLNPTCKLQTESSVISDTDLSLSGTEIVLTLKPVLFIRKKVSGVPRIIDAIVKDIEETGDIPDTLKEIIGQKKTAEDETQRELDDIQELAELGGEDPEILLPLPANREQLEIARRIEKFSGVVVQGPPGTGKTHTIANLLGHLLSEGKSVLVTSDTKKALTVLKDKVPRELQNLCVSLLDENHEDMERSINGIMDYQSVHNVFSVLEEVRQWSSRRNSIISQLADVRKHIRDIKNSEFTQFIYNGEKWSLSRMSEFIHDNQYLKDIIPGEVDKDAAFPIPLIELVDLYASNETVSKEDEMNVGAGLPRPNMLVQPTEFIENMKEEGKYYEDINQIAHQIGFNLIEEDEKFLLTNSRRSIHLNNPEEDILEPFIRELSAVEHFSEWQKNVILAGKYGDTYRKTWEGLIDAIQDVSHASQESFEILMNRKVQIADIEYEEIRTAVKEVKSIYNRNGKIGKVQRIFNRKELAVVEDKVKVNGDLVRSAEDCEAVLRFIDLDTKRKNTAILWNRLIGSVNSDLLFEHLSDDGEPERIANKYISDITMCLDWYEKRYSEIPERMNSCGLISDEILEYDNHLSDKKILDIVLDSINSLLLPILKIQQLLQQYKQQRLIYLQGLKRLSVIASNAKLFYELKRAYSSKNSEKYEEIYNRIADVFDRERTITERNKRIERIKAVAPQWGAAIQNRIGIHGNYMIPDNLQLAWQWKQFDAITNYYDSKSFDDLQQQSRDLSGQYREATEKLCELKAWSNILKKIEANREMQQALNGWADTVKKIGGGHGKMAPYYKKKARELMVKCQDAVPVWIMTTGQVFDNMSPGANQFDVVIVDESSQSSIIALPLLYYAKKAIIVGDDKQVSPLGIGENIEAVTQLNEMKLGGSSIPNYHLYTTKTSLYDLAATTFKPLMLHEHFRCVPAIIGFSNMLSYDYKIRPLRDQSSSNLLPPLVALKTDGERDRQGRNIIEAKTIIMLLKVFLEMPEYQDKTFGVISLLSTGSQVQYLQQSIDIPVAEMEKHKILIGTPAQFQGDERDVIILTMVDSNSSDEGPLNLRTYGADDRDKKRYNVAVSRARDQLWVIHSLDMHRDLKPNDLRRQLLEYVNNPQQYAQSEEAVVKAESPFELAVARHLINHGYSIKQQWQAGAYRIDMVAVDETTNTKIAIECDGEAFHSGEEKIRQDMERQTILERAGWQFIRIRGSEYFKNPEATMSRVMKLLEDFGVHQYSSEVVATDDNYELKQKVINELNRRLQEEKENDPDILKDRKRSIEDYVADTNKRESNINVVPKMKESAENLDSIPKQEEVEQEHSEQPDDTLVGNFKSAGIVYKDYSDRIVIGYDHRQVNTLKTICRKYGVNPIYISPAKAENKTGNWEIKKK